MTNIIFLFPYSIIDDAKYGIPYLKNQGFNVIAFDMSLLLRNKAYSLFPKGIQQTTKTITSYKEFEAKVKEMARNSTFIDYLVGLSYFTLENERIFRILKRYGACYYIISGGALPFGTEAGCYLSRKVIILNMIKKTLNAQKLFKFVTRKIILFLTRHSNLYLLPEKIFSGNSEILEDYIKRYKIIHGRVIPIHSLDHDVYLAHVRNRDLMRDTKMNRNCVFLDETATGHPDDNIAGMLPLDKEPYFRSMNRFFDKIEEETGLEVIVAAHPFSVYEKTPNVFGNRKIIKGKTVDLVSRASLVIMHSSTAINYAILCKKPIVFVITNDMIKKGRSLLVDVMANAIGLQAINIDNEEMLDSMSLDYTSWPKNRYEEYMYKYIKSRDIGEKTVWEIVAEEVKKERDYLLQT